ncbi:MAG: hypothetical protein SGI88_15520 [Candidatus Hydrogenedentes bacterium]|nr:hypothetical protein [Candidatus Hydrogenedentota bacterium]
MSTRIIRTLFFLSCILMGGLWTNYIVTQWNDRVLPQALTAEDIAKAVGDPNSAKLSPQERMRRIDERLIPARVVPFLVVGGGVIGALLAAGVIVGLRFITQEAFERFFPALVSVVLAMATGWFLAWYILQLWETEDQTMQLFLQFSLVLVFGFIGVNLGLTRASNWESLVKAVSRKPWEGRNPKLLDTSVIIDGRIADVCKFGFLEGAIIVPRFVLRELQSIADSSDMLRRARGRRGLDILKQLQAPESNVKIEVIEDDVEQVRDVDGKLVALAKLIGAKVVTNDLNLFKVAQIEGVPVLNLHELANALKTAVLPDEHMHVRIVREGKEAQQGVGYLDDGTMIVVDGGRDHIGHNVAATVTSVLQTSNGRMIFTKLQSVLE